jgi:hypothetical protein
MYVYYFSKTFKVTISTKHYFFNFLMFDKEKIIILRSEFEQTLKTRFINARNTIPNQSRQECSLE